MDIRGRLSTPKGALHDGPAHRRAAVAAALARAGRPVCRGVSQKGWKSYNRVRHGTQQFSPPARANGRAPAHASGAAHPGAAPPRAALRRPCGGRRARQSEPPLPSADRDGGGRGAARRARRRPRAAPCRPWPARCAADRLPPGRRWPCCRMAPCIRVSCWRRRRCRRSISRRPVAALRRERAERGPWSSSIR